MKNKIIILGVILFSITLCILFTPKKEEKAKEHSILYSWNSSAWNEKKDHLIEVIEERNITDLYQEFTTSFLEKKEDHFIKLLKEKKVDVFQLVGHPSWGTKEGEEKVLKEIDKVVEFNQNVENKIKGIVFDIEPYQDYEPDTFDEKALEEYVHVIENAYFYAQQQDLMFVICIPTWYDKVSTSLLRELLKNTDRIEVMNYVVKDTIPNIKNEIQYAKEWKKEITTIYQVNFNYEKEKDKEGDGIFLSYKKMIEDFNQIKKEYSYDKLWIGYHYFDKM